jgi:hypothetical protein
MNNNIIYTYAANEIQMLVLIIIRSTAIVSAKVRPKGNK